MPDESELDHTTPAQNEEHASQGSDRDETAASGSRVGGGGPNFGPPLAAGEVGTLGPYRVLKELGKGGMGAVYLALDTRLDRKLALKIMLPAFAADRDAKERFVREARSAAKIAHDNVVTVFEADERDGVPYITMQFLQGYPLDEFLKAKGAPALLHVIRIAREAALGLAAAHALGLVHRDIKPANLWLEAPNGRVKVLDFGLAKPATGDTELTKSGAVVGTPAYMSPEQARGAKVDHRTDLFSLGTVLYRLCAGKTPFPGSSVMAVLTALAVDESTPVRELNPNVPEALAALIHQLLAKKPENRPQTAVEVAKRLRAIAEQLAAPIAPAPIPMATAADISTSLPVVVNSVPVQPPPVSQMHVTAKPESAFENLDADAEDDETERVPATARPKTEKKPAKSSKGGKGLFIAAGAVGLLVFAGVAAALIVPQLTKKTGPVTENKPPEVTPSPVPKPGPDPVKPAEALPTTYKNALGMEFVKVPKSTGWLGGGAGKPGETKVVFDQDFYLGKYEVTQSEWEAVTGLNPSHFSRTGEGKDAVKDISDADLKRFPVEMVSWDDCQLFLARLNEKAKETGWVYRLPKEAEWDYACRGGPVDKLDSAFDFYFAKPTNLLLPAQANFEHGEGLKRTCKVGSYEPNRLGLYDMHGNVHEWCDNAAVNSDRVHLGGHCGDKPETCRAAFRFTAPPSHRGYHLGFRVARVPVGPAIPTPEWKPSPEFKPVPVGQSPFDKLDPNEIPKEERFDWQPKELVAVIGTHARRIWGEAWSVAMSADGKLVAVCSPRHPPATALTVWDTETRRLKWALAPRGGDAHHHSISFTPDGKRLGFFSSNGWLTLYDLTGPKPTATEHNLNDKLDGKTEFKWSWCGFLEGGRTLATTGTRDVGLFDLTGEKPRFSEAKSFAQDRWSALFDGAIVTGNAVAGGKIQRTTIKNAKFGEEEELPIKLAENQHVAGWSADGKRIVLRSAEQAQIWDLTQNPPKQIGKTPDGEYERYVISLDGRWLAGKTLRAALYRLGGAEAKLVDWLDRTNTNALGGVVLSADGNLAVVATGMGYLQFWDLSGEKPKELPAPFDMSTAVRPPNAGLGERSLAPQGGLVTLRGYDDGYRIWNLTGTKPALDPGHVNFGPATHPFAGDRWLGGHPEYGNGIRFYAVGEKEWRGPEAGPGLAYTSPDGTLLVRAFQQPPSTPWQLEGYDIVGPKMVRKWALDPKEHPYYENYGGVFLPVLISGDNRWFGHQSRKVKDGPLAFAVWRLGGAKPEFYAEFPLTCDPRDHRAAFSPDGHTLCHNPDGRGLVFVDLTGATPRTVTRLDGNNAPGFGVLQVYAIAFNPDSKTVALGVAGGLCGVAVVEAPSGKVLWKWSAENCPHILEFAPDGRHLFVFNANSTLYALRLNKLKADAGADADRKAAEWVLSVGGKMTIKDAEGEREIKDGPLPPGAFTLGQIHPLAHGNEVTDAGLARLKGLTGLTYLHLGATKITDAGLIHLKGLASLQLLTLSQTDLTGTGFEHLAGLKSLTYLDLNGATRVTDAALAHLNGLTELSFLNLGVTSVTDAGLAHLKPLSKLTALGLSDTGVTDAGLEHLSGLGQLQTLGLTKTKVTAAGVAKLAKALPNCKIEWDGGTVEPAKK